MKKYIITILASLACAASSHAQISAPRGGILLGGGYLEDPGKAYGFGQLRGTFYEDDTFAHTAFLEILGHVDDATLEFAVPGGTVLEDGDITFFNITANYELEAKLGGPISFYFGGGAGVEIVSIDDRFDIEIDSDTNFIAQAFGGFRARFNNNVTGQLGVRYLVRDNFSLLGDQFETNNSWALEASVGFRF